MTAIEIADYAFELDQRILAAKYTIEGGFFRLAGLLKEMRDDKLYKPLGFEHFREYLEQPEHGFKHTKVYRLIRVYETYSELGVPEIQLLPIGTTKLDIMIPVVKTDTESWLAKGTALSKADLINEVRAAQGKPEMERRRDERESLPDSISIESPPHPAPCLLHPDRAGEGAHFPITEKMGGRLTIPLCRECHSEYHLDPREWCWTYRRNWSEYLYNLINEKILS